MFRIGQKVVCIDDSHHHPFIGWFVLPKKDSVYTIRSFYECPLTKKIGLRFYEIKNKEFSFVDGYAEPAFDKDGFRPLVTKETDISIFTEILHKAGNNTPVDA